MLRLLRKYPRRAPLVVATTLAGIGLVLAGLAAGTSAGSNQPPIPPAERATMVAAATRRTLAEAELARQRATAIARAQEMRLTPRPATAVPTREVRAPTPTITVVGLHERPRSPAFYHDQLTTGWNGYVGGDYYEVVAGTARGGKEPAFIGVIKGDTRTGQYEGDTYPIPGATKAIRIVAVSPTYQFTVTTGDGRTLLFDLPSRRFVDRATTGSRATPTPNPSGAPTPTAATDAR